MNKFKKTFWEAVADKRKGRVSGTKFSLITFFLIGFTISSLYIIYMIAKAVYLTL